MTLTFSHVERDLCLILNGTWISLPPYGTNMTMKYFFLFPWYLNEVMIIVLLFVKITWAKRKATTLKANNTVNFAFMVNFKTLLHKSEPRGGCRISQTGRGGWVLTPEVGAPTYYFHHSFPKTACHYQKMDQWVEGASLTTPCIRQ